VLMSCISFLGMWMGFKTRSKISQERLRRGFGFFVLIVGIIIVFEEYSKLG
jgi:uncharacterized membrane protein YfcA